MLDLAIDDSRPAAATSKSWASAVEEVNAVNRMIAASMQGVQFLAANTDCQALNANRAPVKYSSAPS